MLGSKTKSHGNLERSIARYEAKLAKAPNPTQRRYAAQMLGMARAALAKSTEGEPVVEPCDEDVVTLHADEYRAL